ncbi:uncharacterized protein METZ01_LOCUS51513 [marine metagenome]|uniref:Cysteine ligase BshC n=1 Tax=marine metagenome TaxID=408172 RepID=A0A381S5C5_9ZZZZ
MEFIVGYPKGPPLVRDYLAGKEQVADFFGRSFSSLEDFRSKATEVDGRFGRAERELAAQAVLVPPGADETRLEAFVEKGGYMVTTGQQPGFLGGPLYNIYKALTAARLAGVLEERLGKPVIPLFWVSSEDHDWDEANHTEIIGVDNKLHRIELEKLHPEVNPAIHRIQIGSAAQYRMEEFIQLLPDNDFSSEYIKLILGSLRPDKTLADGFHFLLQKLLGRFGIFFTDAAHPRVKAHSSRMLLEELGRSEELEAILRRTSERLSSAGYTQQVPVLEGGVNLFLEGSAGRERLYREGDGFRLRTSGVHVTLRDVRERQAEDHLVLSPNVLSRPVVESSVFPTLSYVGGPGEIAYFAQLGEYFRAHGLEMPIVYPRCSVTLVEKKIRKILDKFEFSLEFLQKPFHEVASEVAREGVPQEVERAMQGFRESVAKCTEELGQAVNSIDPTLNTGATQVRGQAFAALEELERKILQAIKRENQIGLNQLEKAQLHLYPDGKPAERVQNPFYFLTRYGGAFLEELYNSFEVSI